VERAFNTRRGITIEEDMLPQRIHFKNTPEGALERKAHMSLVRDWYEENGYDPATGQPTRQTCERLNIVVVADRLAEVSPYKRWDGPPLRDLNTYPRIGKRF
jgi:aldehyde:ferredoxin oxidoreductase